MAALEQRSDEQARACIFNEQDTAELRARLAVGEKENLGRQRGRRPVDVVIGLDFGTSSTKIVARLPYEAGAPAFAVSVPSSARSDGHPHLWSSRMWLDPEGLFSLAPVAGSPAFCAIKTALMRDDGDRAIVLHNGAWAATALETSAAFLALQLRQARGWLLTTHEAALSAGILRWAYNVGFPAASLDNDGLRRRYTAACAAGVKLSRLAEPLSLALVRNVLGSAGAAAQTLTELSVELVPEIAAAVAGFAASPRREIGLYAMVDVGAGTVDCCTFNLFDRRDEGETACPIFKADVSMLGVEPWRVCQGDAELRPYLEKKIEDQQHDVIWETKTTRYRLSDRWRSALPVFLTGGGAMSDAHHRITLRLDEWLRHSTGGKGGARVLSLPVPDSLELECASQDAHRLAVAFGLARPPSEIPKAELPGSIDDDLPAAKRDFSSYYISKDMV